MSYEPAPETNELSSFKKRIFAEISSQALLKNYRTIARRAQGRPLIPMVKANGYGHGAAEISRRLLAEKPAALGVATLREGAQLRQELGASNIPIIVFSGASNWTNESGQLCQHFGLMPVLFTLQDWEQFDQGGWSKRLPFQLKFNTGMNRLGIPMNTAETIARGLHRAGQWPHSVLSHLAAAEAPKTRRSRQQLKQFQELRKIFLNHQPTQFHLANSAAIWNAQEWKLKELTDFVRPGLALYGIRPWDGASKQGLTPVMTIRAQVIATQELNKGDGVGYGFRYEAKSHTRIAILPAGYADGLHRFLSNRGSVFLAGRREPIVGIISMDLTAVHCSTQVVKKQPQGVWAELLGPKIDAWTQARAAGTIPYELLTSVSDRVERAYV